MTRIYLGSPITLAMDLQLYTGAGSTGQTPTVALRRVTDGYYLDFADNTWKASGWTTRLKPLTEVSPTNAPGVYQYVLATSSIITTEGDYIAEYANTGTPAGICAETYSFVATVATGVQAGLTVQGYTTTRAGYLDALNGIVAAIATAVWGAAARTLTAFGFTVATDSDSNVTAIKAKTDNLPAVPAAAGDIPTAAVIRTEIDSNSTQLAAIVADTAEIQGELADGGRTDLLIDAIKAKTDTIAAAPAAADIADAVWDEALSGHTTSGSAGLALSTASSGGVDPAVLADAIWDEVMSGHTTSGSAGAFLALLNSYLDATVSSRLAAAAYTAPDNADIVTILSDVQALSNVVDLIPTLSEIEASAVLAKAAALATVDANVDSILEDTGTTIPASIAGLDTIIDKILALQGLNFVEDNFTYDAVTGEITGSRKRFYPTAADKAAGTNLVATLTFAGTYDGDTNLSKFEGVES